jgi:hypothetical protein
MKNNLDYKVIKNFLPNEDFQKLKNLLFGENISWYYLKHMVHSDDGFFAHNFFNHSSPRSDYFNDFIIPILIKLNFAAVIKVRANFTFKKKKKYFSQFHTDCSFINKTAILYMNTCNGYTILDEKLKIKIKCEENKMLIFNSQIKHCLASQTDEEKRIVINFNYFDKI